MPSHMMCNKVSKKGVTIAFILIETKLKTKLQAIDYTPRTEYSMAAKLLVNELYT